MPGPYNSEADALTEPMPQAVRMLHASGRVRSGDPDHLVRNTVLRGLTDACSASGVKLGDFDMRVLAWLASWETSTAQVVIDLITRAHGKTKARR